MKKKVPLSSFLVALAISFGVAGGISALAEETRFDLGAVRGGQMAGWQCMMSGGITCPSHPCCCETGQGNCDPCPNNQTDCLMSTEKSPNFQQWGQPYMWNCSAPNPAYTCLPNTLDCGMKLSCIGCCSLAGQTCTGQPQPGQTHYGCSNQ